MTNIEVVVVGTSLGGLKALSTFLSGMPDDFPIPIAIVQHRQVESEERLVALLQKHTKLRVCEPEDKEDLAPGNAYLAPCGYHLLLERGYFCLSTEAPVLFARPSIDVLFESAASSYGARTLAVVLTGASADGAAGAAKISQAGGIVVVQDPQTAESPMMPEAAIRSVPMSFVLPLDRVAPRVVQFCTRRDEV